MCEDLELSFDADVCCKVHVKMTCLLRVVEDARTEAFRSLRLRLLGLSSYIILSYDLFAKQSVAFQM